jgi:hypothetical protein
VRIAGADVENELDTGVLRALEHLFAIRVELRPVNVRV